MTDDSSSPESMSPDDYFDYLMESAMFRESAIFFDSPKGRTLFAFAAAYVLKRLIDKRDFDEIDQILAEFREFSDNYMRTSRAP